MLEEAIQLRTNKEFEKAKFIFLQLLEKENNNPLYNYHYAWLLDNIGNEKKAIIHYKTALENNLDVSLRVDCYLGLGSSYRMLGNFKESKKVFDKALKDFPENAVLKLFKSFTMFKNDNSKGAYLSLLALIMKENNNKEITEYSNAIFNFIKTNKTL